MSYDTATLRALLDGPVPVLVRTRGGLGAAATSALLVLACLGLATYVGAKLYHNLTVIAPSSAYLQSDLHSVASPTSGRVTFIADPGPVQAGEPILGIETASGKTVFVDASANTTVVSQDVTLDTRVARGTPILGTASGEPALFLEAIVGREDAFQIAQGATLFYTVLGDAGAVSRTVLVAPGEAIVTALPPANPRQVGQFFRVKLEVPRDGVLHQITAIDVRFETKLQDRVASKLIGLRVPNALAHSIASPFGVFSANEGGIR